ncbi:hypothetical protein ACP4OV_029263 [Aristida adscensionis]
MAGAPPPPAGPPVAPPFLLFDAGEKDLNRHMQYSVASRLQVDNAIDELAGRGSLDVSASATASAPLPRAAGTSTRRRLRLLSSTPPPPRRRRCSREPRLPR